MTKQSGYLKVGTARGIAVYVHWSFAAGGVLVSLLGHADPVQWIYFYLAYTILILLHEGGHVAAARLLGLKVFAIEISGTGGLCRIERPRHVRHSVFVYSAGLLAQIFVFLLTLGYIKVFDWPKTAAGLAIAITFTLVNIILFVANLFPQKGTRALGTDGYVLWKLFLHAYRGHPHPNPPLVVTPAGQTPVFSPETRLILKPGFMPKGFVQGIEILNDNTTPMDFVVTALVRHLGLSQDEAIVKMLDIHNNGGTLIAIPSRGQAQNIAAAISSEAHAAGNAFVCRYAEVQHLNSK
jgi:ATP-dependent Clp protease adapter protein ClpS